MIIITILIEIRMLAIVVAVAYVYILMVNINEFTCHIKIHRDISNGKLIEISSHCDFFLFLHFLSKKNLQLSNYENACHPTMTKYDNVNENESSIKNKR